MSKYNSPNPKKWLMIHTSSYFWSDGDEGMKYKYSNNHQNRNG